MYRTISFYRYMALGDPEGLRDSVRAFCEEHSILGRILVAEEGINGACSGNEERISAFQLWLQKRFPGLTFREQVVTSNTYHKLVVRVRKEIVMFRKDVDLAKKGQHLAPLELKQWYDQEEDFVIVDMRNGHEYDMGHFKNAVKVDVKTFSEFSAEDPSVRGLKDKKVVLYCTGGVRCEKASAHLKEKGFHDVYQLQGGVINYVSQFPDTHWEGGLFVFDDRLMTYRGRPITRCALCSVSADAVLNCHNLDCDKLFVSCPSCKESYQGCCSTACVQAPRQREQKEQAFVYETLGVVENYYAKLGVALVRLSKTVKVGQEVQLLGKTTALFTQSIEVLRDEACAPREQGDAGELVTFPVSQKVRVHDRVVLCN